MQTTVTLSRSATIDMYLYTESFRTRKPFAPQGPLFMTNMYLVPLLDFDVSALRGKEIKSATLKMTCLNKLETLAVDVSTVSQDWNAEVCTNYNRDVNDEPWAENGWMTDVVMSAGHSRYFREKVAHEGQTAVINIDPAVIEAMASGQSYGMLVMDVKSKFYGHPENMKEEAMQFNIDPANGAVPTLTIEYEDAAIVEPKALCTLHAMALSVEDEISCAVQLSWEGLCAKSRRAYMELYISETSTDIASMKKVEKYKVPHLSGKPQGTVITGLKPSTTYNFAAVIVDAEKTSAPVYASAKTLQLEVIPTFPAPTAKSFDCSARAFKAKGFSVGVTDDVVKINPQTGELYDFGGEQVWNNGIFRDGKVSLACARGEKLGFQLSVEIDGGAKDFDIKACGDLADSFSFYKLWCLNLEGKWVADAVVPVQNGKFSVPFAENKINGQKQLTIWVDCLIPAAACTCAKEACITISADGQEIKVPVAFDISPFVLPPSEFRVELNGYVFLPECGGTFYGEKDAAAIEREYYRMGYMHNSTVNILPYTHFGSVQKGFAPEVGVVDGEMRVTDWSEWDAHFGPMLDGSYVEEIVGERVPITHMYLPIHENWPMPINECYKIKVPDLPYPDNVSYQVQNSTTPEEDFEPRYRAGIKSVMKDFAKHIEEKGWKNVDFQYFFNNKNFYKEKRVEGEAFKYGTGLAAWLGEKTTPSDGTSSSWWLLDEPHFRMDWEMLHYYGKILREVQAETGAGKQIKFRADLSCSFQMFDFLKGLLDINVGGHKREVMQRRHKRVYGEVSWPYGSWNSIGADNADSIRWLFDVYLQGNNGIIPWYNFGLDMNYETPDDLAAIYPGQRFGIVESVASTRLKAGRKAQEFIRYFDAMKKYLHYTDAQLKAYITSFIELQGKFVKKDSIDAGKAVFAGSTSALEELKRDMHRKLTVATGMYF